MAMTMAKNVTDANRTVWWGHTPYIFGPKEIKIIPVELLRICEQHEEWKDWIKAHDPSEDAEITSPAASKEPAEPDPWENEEWDALTCAFDEIVLYAKKNNLIIDKDDEQVARMIVDEHFEG